MLTKETTKAFSSPWLSPFRDSASSGACHEFNIIAIPPAMHDTTHRAPQAVKKNSRFQRYNTIHAGYIRLKAFRSQFRSMTDISFFLFRLSKLCA